VVFPINPDEPFYSSLRDKLARFKRATKAVNAEMVECSLALVLYERGLIPEFIL
jgi:hypothetical protein